MNPLFDDYKTIRRRIERKLSTPDFLFLNIFGFFFTTLLLMSGAPDYVPLYRPLVLLIWSIALLGHSLFVLGRSGINTGRREKMLQREVKERVEEDDTELLSSKKQAFRVKSLLDEDLRKRAGSLVYVSGILGLNIIVWFASLVQTSRMGFSGYWHDLARMLLGSIVVAVGMNALRRVRRDRATARHLRELADADMYEKPKRLMDEAYRFNEEGEIIDPAARLRDEPSHRNGVKG